MIHSNYCRPVYSSQVRYRYCEMCFSSCHGWILVENHANWMSGDTQKSLPTPML